MFHLLLFANLSARINRMGTPASLSVSFLSAGEGGLKGWTSQLFQLIFSHEFEEKF